MKTDVKKIMALKKGGWNTQDIAAEMHLQADEVKQIVANETEKHTGHSKKEPNESNEVIQLTAAQLQSIYEKAAAIGAKEAIKVYADERKKGEQKKADRRLHNTKLLLQNYRALKDHVENSVFDRAKAEESAEDILELMQPLYDDKVIIDSIKRSATRTAIIVAHIEVMFGLYQSYCENSSNRDINMRRYEVVWDMYINEHCLSAGEIADKQHISKRNVYEDVKVATARLSALIFGVDGLKV